MRELRRRNGKRGEEGDGGCALMRPDESIEDVLEQIALERIALDAPIRARHGLGGGRRKRRLNLAGRNVLNSFLLNFS